MIKLEAETHTALLGADEILKDVEVGGNPVYADGRPVKELQLRVAYVLHRSNSSVALGLRLPHKRTTAEYETSLRTFGEGDLVNALVVEDGDAYRIVGLLAP